MTMAAKKEDENERLLKTVKQKLETFLLLETEQVERGVMEVIVGFMRQLQRFVLVWQLHSTIVSPLTLCIVRQSKVYAPTAEICACESTVHTA